MDDTEFDAWLLTTKGRKCIELATKFTMLALKKHTDIQLSNAMEEYNLEYEQGYEKKRMREKLANVVAWRVHQIRKQK